MQSETSTVVGLSDRPVDPWALLTGGSVAVVAGFIADLLRLGAHEARRMIATPAARQHGESCDWQRPCPSNR
jgi:hypothetical protein